MPQLLTKPAQKGKKARGASANGAIATPAQTPSKRGAKQSPAPAKSRASTAPKARMMEQVAKTAKSTKATTSAQRRNRRSPVEILQELKTKRDRLHEAMTERIAQLDERIAKLESRHSSKIKVTELLQTHSTDELKTALDSIRKQRSLLRRALKDRLST